MSDLHSEDIQNWVEEHCLRATDPRLRSAVVQVLDVCASTMDAARFCEPTTIVIALAQTAGRGRGGRSWASPLGAGIYLSLSLSLDLPEKDLSPLPLAIGIAASRALKSFGVQSQLKWPNDVIVAGRKAAGILLERGKYVVVGIGLNLKGPSVAGSIGVREIAPVDYRQMIGELLDQLFEVVRVYEASGFEAFRAEWESISWLDGRDIRYVRDGVESNGVVCGVSDDGALIVRDARSERNVMLYSADVHLGSAALRQI